MNLTRSGSTHKLKLELFGYDGASMTSNAELPLKQWTHVAWVADGDVWRFYINGELDSETTGHATHLMCQNPDGIVIGNSWKSNYNGNSATNNGVDFGGYPLNRTMTVGVNINF